MTLRVAQFDAPSGACGGEEIMVSAMCGGRDSAIPTGNGASCSGDGGKLRLVCARK